MIASNQNNPMSPMQQIIQYMDIKKKRNDATKKAMTPFEIALERVKAFREQVDSGQPFDQQTLDRIAVIALFDFLRSSPSMVNGQKILDWKCSMEYTRHADGTKTGSYICYWLMVNGIHIKLLEQEVQK